MIDSPALKEQLPDTPPRNMSTPMQPETTATKPKRKYERKKPPELNTSGIASSEKSADFEDTRRPLTPKETKIVKNLSAIYAAVGFGLALVKPLAGGVIMSESANRAEEVVRVAAHYPKMMEWLDRITEANDQVNLVIGHGVMAYAVLIAADRLPLGERSAQILGQFGYKELVKFKVGIHDDLEGVAA